MCDSKVATVADVQLMYCMCGSLVRRCPYCSKTTEEGPHNDRDRIDCIHCGCPTFQQHRESRSSKVAKTERKEDTESGS